MAGNHHLFKYLQQKKQRTKIDAMMSVAAIAHPLMATPQIYKLYSTKQADDLAIMTWFAWMCFGLIFMAYGISHKLKPYIFMQILWLGVNITIIIGIIIYG